MKIQYATRKLFPCYHVFLFCRHLVLLFVFGLIMHNFRTKWQVDFGLFSIPKPCSLQKRCHTKVHATGEWLRQRVIGFGTLQISRSLVHIQSICMWWIFPFRMGSLMAYIPWNGDLGPCPQEMVIHRKLGLLQLAFSSNLFWPDIEMVLQQSWCLSGWPRFVVWHCGKVGLLWQCCASWVDKWKIFASQI